ncbi:hypothetical protein [Legionella saoudiensis]|uniref:hypothetical protein n=1 Tax=Legionella saoudiensis TaxID=1750561 RepID=UPI000730D385|nr:hypothetical protein [Legionella saoudiensis]
MTITAPTPLLSSDAVHNRNCYAYFLQLKPAVNNTLIELLPLLQQLVLYLEEAYNEHIPYGNLYSSLIASLEQLVEKENLLSEEQNEALDQLVKLIYHNDNHILEQELAGWINALSSQARPLATNTSSLIKKQLSNAENSVNEISPSDAEGLFYRLYSLFSRNFKPQFFTNIPTIKNFPYKTTDDPIEYRFSTQAQRHNGQERVSPLFIRWLKINAQETSQEINHIYFNNLGYHRSDLDIAGSKERDLTRTLHKLEEASELKVMVITLPAHEGIMASHNYQITDDKYSYDSVFNEFFEIAEGKLHQSGVSDFIISPKARAILFQSPEEEQRILRALLKNSFEKQGIVPENSLSTAQKQAVWVHFIKYELTEYIIRTVKPKSYNFSCKDAIDRGALSSTYFNLLKSFETDYPLTKDEFERSLDAAAAMVKGRGMNFHRRIIWNALDTYVHAHYEELIKDRRKSWLIHWRDMNCPHLRVKELLPIRIKQGRQLLELPKVNSNIRELGNHLFTLINTLNAINIDGKRLLLETVSRTSELLLMPSEKSIKNYEMLAKELRVAHPKLTKVAGIMEMILGILLYIPSFGFSQSLINHGNALRKKGFFAGQCEQLSKEMELFSKELSI